MTTSANQTNSTEDSMVDLSTFKLGDWLRMRGGALIRTDNFVYLESEEPYPFSMEASSGYTKRGEYFHDGTDPRDIVEIIPAERMTLLEWITDRVPAKADTMNGYIQALTNTRAVIRQCPEYVDLGQPWAHCPGWTPPTPRSEVKMPPNNLIQVWRDNWHNCPGGAPDWSAYLVRRTAEWCAEQQREVQS